jgi:RHS repeat-associated protein
VRRRPDATCALAADDDRLAYGRDRLCRGDPGGQVQEDHAINFLLLGGETVEIYNVYADHLNTPRLITNQANQAVWRYDNNDPFGGNTPDENPSGLGAFEFPLRDEGTYADKETNLIYNWNRYRDPPSGRFIQADPLGLAGGDLSLYALRKNNPLSFTDPLGLFGCPPGRRAIPAPGNEKEFPKIALCVEDPGSNPNAKICVSAECAAGVLPNQPQDPCERECLTDPSKLACLALGLGTSIGSRGRVPGPILSVPCTAITFSRCVEQCHERRKGPICR